MKSLMNGLLCASLLLAVSCGKDGGGGSSSGSRSANYNQYVTQSTKQIFESLKTSWYNSTTEGSRGSGPITVQQKQVAQANNNQTCDSIELGPISIPYCYSTSVSNSGGDTVLSTQNLTLVRDGKKISAKGNAVLNSIFNGSAGTVVQATQVGYTAYKLDLQKDNIITSYIIDKGYHSLLNPVQKTTTVNGVPSTQYVYAFCSQYGCSI